MLVDTVYRGAEATDIWIGITDARPIEFAGIRLGDDGSPSNVFSSIFFEQGVPPAPCAPGTGQHSQYYRMDLNPDYLLNWPLGAVELVVNLRDIDGITGLSQTLSFELQGSVPILDFSKMPTEFISGNSSTLIVEIIDLDGLENMECSILLKDEDEITLFDQIYYPSSDGLWTQDWTPPGKEGANHTLYFACLDETSLPVSGSLLIRAREAPTVLETPGNATQQGEDERSSTMIIALTSGVLIAIIALTALLINRRDEIPIEEDEELPDDAWARRDEGASDEILAEMAGLQQTEEVEWTDEDLLNAGWNQVQIDIYRSEQQSQDGDEDILSVIQEEE